MILWNAFYTYFIARGNNPKYAALGILIGLFILNKTGIIEWCRVRLERIPAKKWLGAILILGFLLRLIWVLWSPYSPPAAGTEDCIMIRHGQELAMGRGYITTDGVPSADRPVGYAILLAWIFKVFGENLDCVALMNVFLSLVTLGLIYKLGVQMKNEFVGIAAAFFLAIYPTSIFATKIVLEEHVFLPLWLGGIYLLILDYQKPSWSNVLAAGLLFGIAAHVRTFSFAMGGVVFLMWLFRWNFKQAILRALVIQVMILMLAVPWAIRNYHKLGEPILYTTWIGAALYFSNNDTSDVRYPVNPSLEQGGDLAFSKARTEIERNRAGKDAAVRWIKTHPATFVQKAVGRVFYMLGLTREGWIVTDNFNTIRKGRSRPPDKLIKIFNKADNDYYGIVFLLALFGLIIFFLPKERRAHKKGIGYIFVTLVYYLSIIALTLGHRKYRFLIEPFFCILAAYGISFFIKSTAQPERKSLQEQAHG
jgi:4-amino-4-deoxy-L-arabinose transferase-like glycosyltransferase